MKNPFKGIGDKLKNLRDQWKAGRKRETAKVAMDGLGDSGIIGGLALVMASAALPAAPATVLIAGGVFIAAGGAAKIIAWKMKPDPYDVTNPEAGKKSPVKEEQPPKLSGKASGPDFKKSADNKQATPGSRPAAKPDTAGPKL